MNNLPAILTHIYTFQSKKVFESIYNLTFSLQSEWLMVQFMSCSLSRCEQLLDLELLELSGGNKQCKSDLSLTVLPLASNPVYLFLYTNTQPMVYTL